MAKNYINGDIRQDMSFLYRVSEWSDGGLLATGTHFKGLFNPLQKYSFLWLLSTDSIGCLDAQNCGHNIGLPNFQSEPSSYLTVYPNPTKGIINLKVPHASVQLGHLKMVTIAGQTVFQTEVPFENGHAQVQPGRLPSGMYTLVLEMGNRVSHTKIMVQ
jgi:hypothetical protein